MGITNKEYYEINKQNNREVAVDIAKGIGIIFMVGVHCGFQFITHFPPHSFHMPLFYFIAGFFLPKYVFSYSFTFIEFIKRKFITLMIPFFLYNLIFGVIQWLLQYIGIYLNYFSPKKILPITSIINFHNLCIEPFLYGPIQLCGALWFVPSLFVVLMLVKITFGVIPDKYKIISHIPRVVAFIILLIILFYACNGCPYKENQYLAVMGRTISGYVFCILGMIYYLYRDKINHIFLFIISLSVYSLIRIYGGSFGFSFVWNDYGTGIKRLLSFPTILSGILVIISISKFLSLHYPSIKNFVLVLFGRNSYHIMAIHLFFFIILDIILVSLLPNWKLTDIESVYFRIPNINYLYFFFCLYGCYYYILYINKYIKLSGTKRPLFSLFRTFR